MADEKLTVKIEADIGDLSSDTKKARRDVETFADKSENALDDFERAMRDAKSTATTALAGFGAAFAGAVVGIASLVESSIELREENARVVASFEGVGGSADDAMNTFEDLYAIMGDTGAAAEATQLLSQITTDSQELNEWVHAVTGSWASFGESIPLESLIEAANEAINTGEAVGALADYITWIDWDNVDLSTVFGDNQEAIAEFKRVLEETGDPVQAFNAALKKMSSEAERADAIQRLMNEATGDAADKYNEASESIQEYRKAQKRWEDSMGKVAEIFTPVMTALMNFGSAVVDEMEMPMRDAAKFMTEEFIPDMEDAYKKASGFIETFTTTLNELGIEIQDWQVATGLVTVGFAALSGAAKIIGQVVGAIINTKILRHFGDTMDYVGDESGKASKKTKKMGDETEKAGKKAKGMGDEADKASKKTGNMGDAAKKAGKKAGGFSTAMDAVKEAAKKYLPYAGEFVASVGKKAGVIGLVATGAALLAEAVDNAWQPTQHLTEAQQELLSASSKAADEYGELKTQIDDEEGVVLTQSGYHKALADELLSLADASGYVQEKDRARVEYILGELNKAYGIEAYMIDGQIQNYDTLATYIQSVIDKKTVEALLDVNREAYTTALQNEATAWDAVVTAQQAYDEQLAVVQTAEEEYAAAVAALEEGKASARTEADYRALASASQRVINAEANLNLEKGYLDELGVALDGANADYAGYQNDIMTYQNAMALAAQGRYTEAIAMLTDEGKAWEDYEGTVEDTLRANVNALEKNVTDTGIQANLIKEAFDKNIDGFGQEMVNDAEQAHQDALEELGAAVTEATQAGVDVGYGFANGTNAEDVMASVRSKASSLVSNMISAMRAAADSHSPSRKTMALGKDMGAGLELGIDDKAQDVAASASKMIQEAIVPIDTNIRSVSYTDFADSFGTSLGSLSYSNNRMAEALINTMVGRRNSNTPIILEVDGKVFAQTSIDTINKLTRQTGSLGLQLV